MRREPGRRFLFRLALALGRPVGELLRSMSSRELAEWIAFDALEPVGEYRADVRSAIVASTVAAGIPLSPGAKRPEPADFMPFVNLGRGGRGAAQSVEDMIATARAITARVNRQYGDGRQSRCPGDGSNGAAS